MFLIFASRINSGNIVRLYLPTLMSVPDENAANKVADIKSAYSGESFFQIITTAAMIKIASTMSMHMFAMEGFEKVEK